MRFSGPFIALLLFAFPAWAELNDPCPRSLDNVALLSCMEDKLRNTQADLEKAEQAALKSATKLDKAEALSENGKAPDEKARNEKALHESSKAFLNYRQAECARRLTQTGGASMGGHVKTGCEIELTRGRIAALKNGNE